MQHDVTLTVDGQQVQVAAGSSVLAALASHALCTRRSVTGEARFALCGMGQCQECRVTIDGKLHQLACQVVCRDSMNVNTGARK